MNQTHYKMLKQMLLLAVCLGILLSCQSQEVKGNMSDHKEKLDARIERLSKKYDLRVHYFDAECLYDEGDLALTLSEFLTKLLPEQQFRVTESLTPNKQQVIAQVFYQDTIVGEVTSEVGGDYLPDSFYTALDSIPARAKSKREMWMVNPRLYGQDGCYISGTTRNLMAARQEGLPLLLPTETTDDMMKADISDFE
ncbi:hypothetical protein H8B15_19415 [Hymenobacter sp. BT507]|uniref:Uncharacterized protein n=1 Tax=Hymenobacter citatus TaxID=2763506 RepID=A0ABR7MPV2_9BACT|nr:hypothetical protein [Hymenobacter citatus]MBC6613101.1 hypothetical protein [Hymenobacter citatus]